MSTPSSIAIIRLSASRARLHWALSTTHRTTDPEACEAGINLATLLKARDHLEVAKAVITPIAQSHPWRLVLGAFCVGGAVALTRPWRWDSASTLLRTLIQNQLGAPAHRRHRR
jgi:hypothetical protein